MGARRKQRLLGADVDHLVHTHQLALAKDLQGIGPLGRLVNDELHPARGQPEIQRANGGSRTHGTLKRRLDKASCFIAVLRIQGWARDGSGMGQGWAWRG